jgi:hypothetical protein
VPARRDYADAWRDAWVTLAQVPVAGLVAADYFYQQWVERSATYLSQMSARLAFARPAADIAGGSFDNVVADVLSEDLVRATRALVRDLVSLPGQTAQYFDRRLEAMINDVLIQVQPDAKADVRAYVITELDKLNRDLHRIREVAGAETFRRQLAPPGERPAPGDQADEEALRDLLVDLRSIAEGRLPGPLPSEREAIPRERMLLVIQAVVDAALARFPPERKQVGDEARDTAEQAARLLLALQSAQSKLEEAEVDLEDELGGGARPRKRREGGRTRRTR